MLAVELQDRIKELLKGCERCVLADCVYKNDEYRAFAISVSDSREKDFNIPYADITGHEDDDLIELLKIRKGPEMQALVRPLIEDLYDFFEEFGFNMNDKQKEIDGFTDLTKPVLLLSFAKLGRG